MSRVLVTGATGMLGLSATNAFEAAGHTVIRHSRNGQGDWTCDLTSQDSVCALLTKVAPDVVINLVALTNVDICEQSPADAFLLNTRVVENLAFAIREADVPPHLIQISTDQVFDGAGPHAEPDVTLTNYYAFSKYAGELAATQCAATVIRTNFFGLSNHATRRSFSDWVFQGLREKRVMRVFDDVLFSPLSMASLTKFLCLCIVKRLDGVFNLGSREGMSKAEFCYAFAQTLGMPADNLVRVSVKDASLPARRPLDMRMICTKFENAFGAKMPSLSDEIATMKGFYNAGL